MIFLNFINFASFTVLLSYFNYYENHQAKRPVPFQIVHLCTRYIACYFGQLFLLIQAFEDVKSLSESAKKVSSDESTEMLLIQKLHQNFTFSFYGVEKIEPSLMELVFKYFLKIIAREYFNFFQIISSIVSFLVLLQEFSME